MARSRGNNAQFTYDFGIAIAQSTVSKITRLTGATLTLASAFYALKTTASEYVNTLRENTLRFGGVLSTMKAMEQAQDRLIKGQSYFNVDDQLKGMNQLMAAGINVGKNLDWINKAAHATGKSYSEFSGMIASAIQGNSQALVDAGLMTQRATRMFDKYAANTIMRQQAILNFVKNHKGLMNAIKNDFETIQDQMTRIRGIWQGFLHSIMGKPNDPQSFYGQIVSSMKMVATALSQNMEKIKRYGFIIGQTLGWVIRQIGHFVVWVGRQVKKSIESVWKVTDDFQNQTRSMLVWLEFWKLKIVDFFTEYGNTIKNILKLILIYKALKYVFIIGSVAVKSIMAYRAALLGTLVLQKKYMASMGPYIGKVAKFFQSLAVWLPMPFRRAWVTMGKFFADFRINMSILGRNVISAFKTPFRWLTGGFRLLLGLVKNLPALLVSIGSSLKALWVALNATNPLGWIILAVTLLTTLYIKSKSFRVFINNLFKGILEFIKLVWNSIAYVITYTMVGLKKVWEWFKSYIWNPIAGFFKSAVGWIDNMWKRFMNTAVGKWIDKWIVKPIKSAFEWIVTAWNSVVKGIGKVVSWLSGANDNVSQATDEVAKKHGVPGIPTFEGGKYDTKDDTNYLNPRNWGGKSESGSTSSVMTSNPLLTNNAPQDRRATSTNMAFNNGAIQIIVQKGEGIDEGKLARKIRQVILDLKREGDMRGGTI